jgi:type VI secretion system protein ImpJ
MGYRNKIVWTEGMFLRPQHFQQESRYLEHLVRKRAEPLMPFSWGFTRLEIAEDLLAIGKIAVTKAEGVLPDGTPFAIPEDASEPIVIELKSGIVGTTIFLCLPVMYPGTAEYDLTQSASTAVRYGAEEVDLIDAVVGAQNSQVIRTAKLRLVLLPGDANLSNLITMPIARVIEVGSNRKIQLDRNYAPPTLNCLESPQLLAMAREVIALLGNRAQHLVPRILGGSRQGTGELADFLMLQLVNGNLTLMKHMIGVPFLHPEKLYQHLLVLVAELSTFTSQTRRPPEFPIYNHDDLVMSFTPLVTELRTALSAVLEQAAVPIPLQLRNYGIRVGTIADRSLIDGATFVIAAKASVLSERLRTNFPPLVKIGAVEEIRDLINGQLQGVGITPLPSVPRQLPFNGGAVYFELDRQSPQWRKISQSSSIAIQVAGDFPDLELELWAIRR